MTRTTLARNEVQPTDVDRAKMDATTEADIERHRVEDGEERVDFDGPGRTVLPAAAIRRKLGMKQADFARLIGIPVGTLRNWEQGRVLPDPAARALLTILAREPTAALRALRSAA